MPRVKKGPVIALSAGILVVILAIAFINWHGSKPAADTLKNPQNPYITTAAIVKIPVAPIAGTQVETGYRVIIVDGFTSTVSVVSLSDVYAQTTASGIEEIIEGTQTTKIAENANYDPNSSMWTVYRTTMGMDENKVISFTTDNYDPLFDVLKYYYLSPHYITYLASGETTPIVYIYSVNGGVMTLLLEPSAVEYHQEMTYTTTSGGEVYTIIEKLDGSYYLTSAKYATEILPAH